jgi:hypothetical protein
MFIDFFKNNLMIFCDSVNDISSKIIMPLKFTIWTVLRN